MQAALWDPLGMEHAGSWSTDSRRSDFEKMQAGVNARAVDFAKLGQLYLDEGRVGETQVVPESRVRASTEPYFPAAADYYGPDMALLPGRAYYGLMWWGFARDDGSFDFAAEGDKGQFIYVSPSRRLVIVRHGTAYGLPWSTWLRLFYDFAGSNWRSSGRRITRVGGPSARLTPPRPPRRLRAPSSAPAPTTPAARAWLARPCTGAACPRGASRRAEPQ